MSPTDDRNAVRKRLGKLFDVPFTEHGSRWDSLWQTGDLPFDKGFPNPALADALLEKQDLFGSSFDEDSRANGVSRRKRALVPGCGRGYDVLLLAGLGYEAYGLEVSSEAINACEKFAAENAQGYAKVVPEVGPGPYRFIKGDFFDRSWESHIESGFNGFDLIYDYTFLSALPPQARPIWSSRMTELLKSTQDSRLICVEFPTYKDPSSGGPPFGLPPDIYIAHLSRPGEELAYHSGLPDANVDKNKPSNALERIAHWRPLRTHDIGQGTDWISVWRHMTAP